MQMVSIIRLRSIKYFQRVIVGCFCLLMILMFVLSGNNYFNLSSLSGQLSLALNNNEKNSLIYNLRSLAHERLILLHRMVQEIDPFILDDQMLRHSGLAEKFINLRQRLEGKIAGELELPEMEKLKQTLKQAQPAQRLVVELVQDKKYVLAKKALDVAINAQEKVVAQLEIFADIQNSYNQELAGSTARDLKSSYFSMVVITGFVILLAILTSWFVVRVITAKNNQLVQANATIALTNQTLEAAIERSKAAQQTKSEFISNMSHELRTPMTSIRGALGMLNSGMVDNIPEDAKTMINIADTNSEHLMELISDVLDFSKFEEGQLELIHREFVVRDELEKVLIPFATKIKHKGIELKVNYDQQFPEKITADLEHLKHIINQLLSNAIKFTDRGLVEITMGIAVNRSDLMVSIRDTGIGIPRDDISRIFERFEQGDGSSTRKYGGTGIGLAICQKLVVALNGEIGVNSEQGNGSTFWFTIPIDFKQKAA